MKYGKKNHMTSEPRPFCFSIGSRQLVEVYQQTLGTLKVASSLEHQSVILANHYVSAVNQGARTVFRFCAEGLLGA